MNVRVQGPQAAGRSGNARRITRCDGRSDGIWDLHPIPWPRRFPLADARLGLSGAWRLTSVCSCAGSLAGGLAPSPPCVGWAPTPVTVLRQREGAVLRRVLTALGPTFHQDRAKRSRRASTSYRLSISKHLASLQDAVPPFLTAHAQAIISRSWACHSTPSLHASTDPSSSGEPRAVYRAGCTRGGRSPS